MVVRIWMIALCGGVLASVILADDVWAWSSNWYRMDEALRLSFSADEQATGTVLSLPVDAALATSATSEASPNTTVPDFPAQPTLQSDDAAPNALDTPETMDFDVPIIRTAKVDKHVQFFASHIRDRFEVWLSRLERHRPMIEQIFAEFNLPADLIFLSLVESGFNTNAVSRAKAVGPWQFIKSTAKVYGLRMDNWVDERRDPVKSTLAAAQYLRDLYQLFGSWPLAMAAYNAGERKVGRALARAQADDFWDLTDTKLIKRETREYVPRFLAAALIARDPARFGFSIPLQTPVEYDEVVLTHPLHLRTAAQAAGVSYEELKALNPELRKDLTPPDPAYNLRIPAGRKTAFLSNLAMYQDWKRIHALQHRVRRGETLARLASRYGTTVPTILEANALSKSDRPKPGDWLLIPQPFKTKS